MWLGLYGVVVVVLDIGRHKISIIMRCCLEVSVQECVGVGMGMFFRK